jgi:beta-glucanase (GH16 family)
MACAGHVAAATPGPEACDLTQSSGDDDIFFDDFNAPQVDPCKWKALNEAWTPADDNGGVIRENVTIRDGLVRLRAFGNLYSGSIRGVSTDGGVRPDGRRTGAAISTNRRFYGGRFEARVRIAGELGVCSAMWTYFHAAEPDEPVLNHEIDIEFPGRENIDAPPSLKHVALTTWTGLQIGQSTTAFRPLKRNVSEFLVLRFDWQPPADGQSGRVDFYIDGERIYTARTNIPSKPAPLLLGVWFPKEWAGNPEFDETDMLIDWVRVSPRGDARTD